MPIRNIGTYNHLKCADRREHTMGGAGEERVEADQFEGEEGRGGDG